MRHCVIFNPGAESGRAGGRRQALEAAFRARGLDADFRATKAPGHAVELVAGLTDGAYDAVVSAGGDGTLFEVVNGLMERSPDRREALGVLPLGTGNAFARDLGLAPGALEPAMDLIAAGNTRPVDVGQVTTDDERFHFINIIGAGFVVDAGRLAQRLKFLGRGAYTLGALASLVRIRHLPLQLELDGKRIDQECFFLEISNSRFTGTHFLMAPEAKFDDGLLDVVVVGRLSRRRAVGLFPTIYDGRHVQTPEVDVYQAREISVKAPAGLECAADGEFRGRTPLTVRCVPGALRLYAP